ncbi:MAG TPA: cytochrome c [Burkholderiaceae bacterium]|jgi:cytochrome c553|nr:cytochrome c [Burkholderiaceae bacterium]
MSRRDLGAALAGAAFAAAGLLAPAAAAADLENARKIHERQCAQCHGKDGNTPLDASYPRLAGQHRDYLLRTMLDYQSGARKNAIMGAQVQALSRRDLRDLAAFYAGLPGQLHIKR